MKKMKAQFIFEKDLCDIWADSIIQLKNGKIIFYPFSYYYDIRICDEKTFKRLLEIDLYKIIYEYENGKKSNYLKTNKKYNNNKNCIKELHNGLILIGRDEYLIEINLSENTFVPKILKKFDNIILEINELSDKRIIVITNENIIIFKKENEQYIIKNTYPIIKNWRMIPLSLTNKSYEKFNQYFYCDELPNNRLLLKSFSIETKLRFPNPDREISKSKIIFIDMNEFKEIKSTEVFDADAYYILLNNYLIIHTVNKTYTYDINSLEHLININFKETNSILYQFNNKCIFSYSNEEAENILEVYFIENNKYIKQYEIESDKFEEYLLLWNDYVYQQDYKFLFPLRNGKIIILSRHSMHLMQLIE